MRHPFHLVAFVIYIAIDGLGPSEALVLSPLAQSEFAVVNHENGQILRRVARQFDPPPPPPPPNEMPSSRILSRVARQLDPPPPPPNEMPTSRILNRVTRQIGPPPPPPPPPYELAAFQSFILPDWLSKSFRKKREAKGGGSMPTRKG